MLKARVLYNEKEDSFDIEINTGDGWGLSKSFKCQPSAKHPEAEANMLHFSIITSLRDMQSYGYKISFE